MTNVELCEPTAGRAELESPWTPSGEANLQTREGLLHHSTKQIIKIYTVLLMSELLISWLMKMAFHRFNDQSVTLLSLDHSETMTGIKRKARCKKRHQRVSFLRHDWERVFFFKLFMPVWQEIISSRDSGVHWSFKTNCRRPQFWKWLI